MMSAAGVVTMSAAEVAISTAQAMMPYARHRYKKYLGAS